MAPIDSFALIFSSSPIFASFVSLARTPCDPGDKIAWIAESDAVVSARGSAPIAWNVVSASMSATACKCCSAKLARQYLDMHGMAGCFCNHSKDPNAMISWTLVTAVDAPRCALVPTIVALRRIEAGEFVMLDYGINYNMQCQ